MTKILHPPALCDTNPPPNISVARRLNPVPPPPRHAFCNCQSLLVAAVGVHIKVPGHDLVDRVVRRPDVLAVAKAVEQLLRESAQVAVLLSCLTLREFGDHTVGLLLQPVIPRACVCQGAGRKVVAASKVPAQLAVRLLPAPEGLG